MFDKLTPGSIASLEIEKPAAGGRMIARANGQVVLVSGAIPGERVQARVTRVGKGVAYADTVAIDEPSPDRRTPLADPACGGCLYSHVNYDRQLALKSAVIVDAFARIGRIQLPTVPVVMPSPERGYRMRARLHVRSGVASAGFFREGTHESCDARSTGQMLPATMDAVDQLVAAIQLAGPSFVQEIEVSENVDATQRAVHLELTSRTNTRALAALELAPGLTGLSFSGPTASGPVGDFNVEQLAGDPIVRDRLIIAGQAIELRRHVLSFFQGNRYLLADLVSHVVSVVEPAGPVIDLYAGVGLFAAALAGVHGVSVVAVEGDRLAARDLTENVRPFGDHVEAVCQPVEQLSWRHVQPPRAIIVDPPRTGMSKEALDGAIRLRASRLVYVSCDVATLARDSRRLVDAGYAIQQIAAFDLFPNTPHVETVVVFDHHGAAPGR